MDLPTILTIVLTLAIGIPQIYFAWKQTKLSEQNEGSTDNVSPKDELSERQQTIQTKEKSQIINEANSENSTGSGKSKSLLSHFWSVTKLAVLLWILVNTIFYFYNPLSPRTLVASYFHNIQYGFYPLAWQLMSDDYKRLRYSDNINRYRDTWTDYSSVKVEQIELSEVDELRATINVHLTITHVNGWVSIRSMTYMAGRNKSNEFWTIFSSSE